MLDSTERCETLNCGVKTACANRRSMNRILRSVKQRDQLNLLHFLQINVSSFNRSCIRCILAYFKVCEPLFYFMI